MTELQKENFKCEYCNGILSSISSLNNHKKTNKKCLLLRDIVIIDKKEFICSECGFKSNLKHHISRHKCRSEYIEIYKKYLNIEKEYKICLEKLDTIEKLNKKKENKNEKKLNIVEERLNIAIEKIDKLKNKNTLLKIELTQKQEKQENQLFTLASKPTSVKIQNLTNILGNLEFKENSIKETVDNNYNIVYLNEGIKGLAQFTRDHIINAGDDGKKKYLCSDPARAIFKYKDENGVIQKDVKATKLKKAIQEPILNKTKSLLEYEILRVRDEGEEEFDMTDPRIIDNIIQVKNLEDNGLDYAREMSLLC